MSIFLDLLNKLRSIQTKSSNLNPLPENWSTEYFESGSLKKAILAKDTYLKIKQHSLELKFQAGTAIAFHQDGFVARGTIADTYLLTSDHDQNVKVTQGSCVKFDSEGRLLSNDLV